MIRKPFSHEREQIFNLLHIIFTDMELDFLDIVPKETLKDMMLEAMLVPNYRYHLDHCLVYEKDQKIAGVVYGYPGKIENIIDQAFTALYPKYEINPANILFVDSETFAGEWYLDSLVVHPDFRNQGIAKELLFASRTLARDTNEFIIGLNCDISNPSAESIYRSVGFDDHSLFQLGSHQYKHLQWNYSQN